MTSRLLKKEYRTQLCVVGGGLAGLATAVSAARHGAKVILIHDRPVLGGNASSEIRMWVGGAKGKDNREGGLVEEWMLENYFFNPNAKFTLWDTVLYDSAIKEENLTLLLNTSVMDAECDGDRIVSVTAWQSNAETFHKIYADYFADCSGDSILAPLSGAEFRYGREAKSEFGESIPPDVADRKTMGMSCLFQIRETDHKVSFTPPAWAYSYPDEKALSHRTHGLKDNFWWIEVGGLGDCIHETDLCREELLKIAFGVWDHIKNHGDHGADNWELEWVGFLPGKRESRRYVGEYLVTQNDVEAEGRFSDLVAYAGWSMDDHFPEGFYYKAGCSTIWHPAPRPWGLPLRCMISKNIQNLVFAGRNISVTHAALSSSRVMATCGILGQALGTAVAQCLAEGVDIRKVDISRLQQTLMADDCYLPWQTREVSELSKNAACNADVVRNGCDRGEENLWIGHEGEFLEYTLSEPAEIKELRIVFDSDLNRKIYNMPCRFELKTPYLKVPSTLIRTFSVELVDECGNKTVTEYENHRRFVRIPVGKKLQSVRLIPHSTWGAEDYRVFAFELI